MTVGIVNNWADLGVVGRVDVDSLTINYVCVATNTWVKAAIATW